HITDAVAAQKAASGGVLVYFDKVTAENATGLVKVHFENARKQASEVYFTASLRKEGVVIKEFQSEPLTVEANADQEISQTIQVDNPKLWSPQHPNLYQLEVTLYADGQMVDQITETTGIRDIALNADGFYLNGEKLFIRGTNRHQEYPYIGYAISPEADYRDAVKIKNAGFDFVRLSHYPQSTDFLDACDELGLIVMNCIPGWQFFGEDEFRQNSYQDVVDMIRRDRNHPSIFFWEISLNESGMDDAYIEKVNELLDQELSFENIFSAGWMDHKAFDLFIPARQHAKPPQYWTAYKNGDRKIFIAEYGDWEYYAQNAGFNQKAFSDLKEEERTSRQLRGSGEKRLLQQALNYQESANSNRKGENTVGDANWLMFDYNRGYADDIESSGISDIFRIPKFAYYFYKSQRPVEEKLAHPSLESGPMIKIASYWTPSSATDVKVFSNCDEVELFLNGKSISRNAPDTSDISDHLLHPPFIFNLKAFEEGILKAVGFVDGKPVAEDSVTTAGEPAKIRLSADKSGKEFTSNDVIFIYAQVFDKNNVKVHESGLSVHFSIVSGEGEIIGGNKIESEAGIATILLKTHSTGNIKIKAERAGLEGDEITLEILGNKINGLAY
ncbi:MAG TPA: glycoside hydrolase family 2 TIM barrel-domain containing protein, partial [Salinimicrobium sp.]|nr:glycoside hydrolase family 2 TIM barrel-domain containing protein [Salinimicrobium sp.]